MNTSGIIGAAVGLLAYLITLGIIVGVGYILYFILEKLVGKTP